MDNTIDHDVPAGESQLSSSPSGHTKRVEIPHDSERDDSDYNPEDSKSESSEEDSENSSSGPTSRRLKARDARTAHTKHNRKYERMVVFPWMDSSQPGQKRPLSSTYQKQRKKRAGQKDIGLDKLQHVDLIDAQTPHPTDQDMPQIKGTTKKAVRAQVLAASTDIHQTKTSWAELDEAARLMGLGNCSPKDGKWNLKHLLHPLYSHQLLCVNFMLRRECSLYGPYGGINADSMGLGKTVEALACIVSNAPQSEDIDAGLKATLWVAPASSLQQIQRSVRKFCSKEVVHSVITYNRRSIEAIHREDSVQFLQDQDIIIVSYENLIADFGKLKNPQDARKNDWSMEKLREVQGSKLGPLFKFRFYRVILDEGHRMKNRSSLTCAASQFLDSKYRWLLTGTPIHNSIGDIYAYLKFLRAPWTAKMTYRQFSGRFTHVNEKAQKERLDEVIGTIMIRRTHQDRILGQPLFKLPLAHRDVLYVSLSEHWRPFYQAFRKQYRIVFNTRGDVPITKERKISTNIGGFSSRNRHLTNILRLRQLADGPLSLAQMINASEDFKNVQAVVSELAKRKDKNPLCDIVHDWCDAIQGLPRTIHQTQEICGICGGGIYTPLKIGQCGHSFCLECISDRQDRNRTQCPMCRRKVPSLESDIIKAWSREVKNMKAKLDGTSRATETAKQTKAGKGKNNELELDPGKDMYGRKPKRLDQSAGGEFDMMKHEKTDIILGAKMCTVRALISQWQSDAPNDKIIVFTHFNDSGEVIGHLLHEMGIKYAYFFGQLDQTHRDTIVTDFDINPELKALIISMKCGGEALHLTSANRVIILEPWWNVCMEEQAFGRVFRLGQEKETYLVRILMKSTIEVQMDKLAKKKAQDRASTLQDSMVCETDLSMEHIAALLGRPTHDKNGKLVAESDDEDEDGNPTLGKIKDELND